MKNSRGSKNGAQDGLPSGGLVYAYLAHAFARGCMYLFYVDIDSDAYIEFRTDDSTGALAEARRGTDFFGNCAHEAGLKICPADLEYFLSAFTKDRVLAEIGRGGIFSMDYRIMDGGRPFHVQLKAVLVEEEEGPSLIICINDDDARYRETQALKEDRKKNVTYTQIAEILASHYDLIYYIDCENSDYEEFSIKKMSGELKVMEKGGDFFAASRKNAERLVCAEDRERIRLFLDRDNLISQLEGRRQLTEDYRMIVDGGKTQYTRMTVTYSSDHSHFIICIENREKDVRREQEHLAALSMANEMARRDELTHTKNKTAYDEAEKELQKQIEEKGDPFGIVVCDINGLKAVNDTEGHRAGDDYIKDASRMICRIFRHSPVFRIGGDEFVVILKGQDYADRTDLIAGLRRQVGENIRAGEGAVVASGLAQYRPHTDHSVADIFNRADSQMYEDKAHLKEQKLIRETRSFKKKAETRVISEQRRIMLDALYKAFEVVSEGTYVFLCDMKYDFSRWSKNAVDTFGLPSEYMYGAGDIWEDHIHPEDREAYHKGIDDIFSGHASGHDMQYRARRTTGEYDVCTCRGVVIRDQFGDPDYFAGVIRNHGIQGHVDVLTGLRNQYGFFEDLDASINRNKEVSVALFGISKFSEINEMYGYHFGNRVLQTYARDILEGTENRGRVYRIDGTRFAVISNTYSISEMRDSYDRLRMFLHEDFQADDRKILLDLHCGALRIKDFDIDSQTAYACLNFADEESKIRKQGDMVEFGSDMQEESHQRLEKLHVIRGSIMHSCEGFFLLYQPFVDAKTKHLTGAEALLRWKNDSYGIVPPDQFIPVLESDPLFPELGEWIIREAILTAKQILEKDPDFVINVNLSYTQLEKPDFADMVLRILDEIGYPPEHLCFEITERCRLLDVELLKNVVANLKSRGILIAMDDFGTGFSSIGILREIPVDIIKIDRSFVRTIEDSEVDRQFVRNIVNLAALFGAKVCAEGIETAGMRDILRDFNVESFQGYYYAKPLPPEQLPEWKES